MEKETRKKRNSLGISGIAVIAFGLWSIVKIVIIGLSSPGGFSDVFDLGPDLETSGNPTGLAVFIISLIIFVGIDLALRLFVGFSARAESKGKKKSIAYLIAAVLLILVSIFNIGWTISSTSLRYLPDSIIAIILELTAIIALLDVILSSAGLRKIKKQLAAEEI